MLNFGIWASFSHFPIKNSSFSVNNQYKKNCIKHVTNVVSIGPLISEKIKM